MYIVRWLMGHPIIAAWVLAVIAFLLVLGDEQGDKTGRQKIAIMEQANDSATSLKKESKLSVNVVETGIQNKSDTSIASVENDNISTNTGSLDKNSKSSTLEKLSSNNPVVTIVSSNLEEVNADELLQMARESFWNDGFDEAADLYKKLIELEPTIIEHKGELGNVYWKQGYPKKAAKQYLEIATPLIESGNSKKVANMIGFIGIFYPKQAAELSNKLQFSK